MGKKAVECDKTVVGGRMFADKVVYGLCKNKCSLYGDGCLDPYDVKCPRLHVLADKYNGNIKEQTATHVAEKLVSTKSKESGDMVKEPSHYQHGTFEVIDEMVIVFGVEKTIVFCQLNSWKYRARAPYKGKFDEDMAKANQYLVMAYELQMIRQEYPEAEGYEVVALLKGRKKD